MKIIDYIIKNGVLSLLVLIASLIYKKISRRYADRQLPIIVNWLLQLFRVCANFLAYFDNGHLYHWPSYKDINIPAELLDQPKIIALCEDIINNRFSMDHDYQVDFNDEHVWHRDPTAKQVMHLNADLDKARMQLREFDGDVRLMWEFTRLQLLIVLAQGYVLTNNTQYADQAIKIVKNWEEKNPYKKGPNWLDDQEVGIRMTALLISRAIFRSSGYFSSDMDSWDHLIDQHASYILGDISIARSTHNHFMTELVSMFIFALMTEKNRYKNMCAYVFRFMLRREIKKQLNNDGLSAEGSTNYTFFIYDAILLANHMHQESYQRPLVEEGMLVKMHRVIEQFAVDDHGFVKIGDADGGRYQRFHWPDGLSRIGYKAIIKYALNQLGDGDISPELWWLNPAAMSVKKTPASEMRIDDGKPVYYQSSGFLSFVANNKNLYLRLGPPDVNLDVRFGHMHSDFLSFTLYKNGEPLLADPGTYTYLGKTSQRKRMRSASFHNTVTFAEREFVDVNFSVFGLPALTTVDSGALKNGTDYYWINSSFTYDDGVVVHRSFIMQKNLQWILMLQRAENYINSGILHENFCAVGEMSQQMNNMQLGNNGQYIKLHFLHASEDQSFSVSDSTYAPRYGMSLSASRLSRKNVLAAGAYTLTLIDCEPEGDLEYEFDKQGNSLRLKSNNVITDLPLLEIMA